MDTLPVALTGAVRPRFDVELITETAGRRLTGGSGASCWGYNQSNIVRAGDQVCALSWRDDLTVVVWQRQAPGVWEPSDPFPPVPQNGNLLVDPHGRLHLISGANACWHAFADPPGQVRRWTRHDQADGDSRFGAAVDDQGRILVAGGLEQLRWYVLDGEPPFAPLARGAVANAQPRGYHFVAYADGQAHAFCSDDYFLPGEQYPNQTVRVHDPATGEDRTIVTPRGIYPVLRTYYYHNPDLLGTPDDWRVTVVSDVADTFVDGARGTTEQQDLLLGADGTVHLLYFENGQPSAEVWASTGQDEANSRLYHAAGRPGGPLARYELGAFNSGRLCPAPDGRLHYLLTRGRRGQAQSLWYAVSEPGQWDRMSAPVPLDMPSPFWHFFVSTQRAGGPCTPWADCYWTGMYQGNSHQVWYGRLTPA